jgi:hypothetical protein
LDIGYLILVGFFQNYSGGLAAESIAADKNISDIFSLGLH